MSKTYSTCVECGARLVEGAAQCNLCGWPVETTDALPAEPEAPASSAALPSEAATTAEPEASTSSSEGAVSAQPADRPARPAGVYCNQCGWKNPPGARFCSQCGAPLQVLEAPLPADGRPVSPPARVAPGGAPARPEEAPEVAASPEAASQEAGPTEHQAISRQVGIIVGAGLLLVVALFLVKVVSKTWEANTPAQPAQQALPSAVGPEDAPLPAQLADQVAAIEAEMTQLDGAARAARQRDLIPLFFSAGRLDRAALEQRKIAETTGAVDDWKRAGDLFYDWMNTVPEGQRKAQVAAQAIEAYQTVLAETPDNLDVRTDMATAYLSSGNPMLGVTEVKRVLEANPDHLRARFNYGLMLSWINRPEQAIEQFEHVKTLVDETADEYQKADEAIRTIRASGNL